MATSEQMELEVQERIEALEPVARWYKFAPKGYIPVFDSTMAIGKTNRKASEEELEHIRAAEEEWGVKVYACALTDTQFGRLLTMFLVTKYDEEWEMDRKELSDNGTMAYVENLDDPICSEFGHIGFEVTLGGCFIERVW